MTGKRKILLAAGLLALCAVVFFIWYSLPVRFLSNDAQSVQSIEVFDGNTGAGFTITDAGDIEYIVSSIQSATFRRDGSSLGYSGYRFRVSFYDAGGRRLDSFIINSADTIRKDPFFYRSVQGGLCVDDLWALEEALA